MRSAEAVCARYPGTIVWGHRNAGRRLADRSAFRELAPGSTPPGVRAYHIGRPRRAELPVLVESHAALAFGDAIVGTDDGLRMWCNEPLDERRLRFYAERFAPTRGPAPGRAVRPRPRHARAGGRGRRTRRAHGGRRAAALVPPRLAARISEKWMTVTVASSVTSRL